MKRIVCEICGSQDLVKENGVFVCENCGTKYSLEDAKKMLVEVNDITNQKNVNTNGESSKLENSILLMTEAFKARNMEETNTYAVDVLKIDGKNATAWILKGISFGYISLSRSVFNLPEMYLCFKRGMGFADDENKKLFISLFKKELDFLESNGREKVLRMYQKHPDDLTITKILIEFISSYIQTIKDFNAEFDMLFDEKSIAEDYGLTLELRLFDVSIKSIFDDKDKASKIRSNQILILESMVDWTESKKHLEYLKASLSSDLHKMIESDPDNKSIYLNECLIYCKRIDERLEPLLEIERKKEKELLAKQEAEKAAKEEAQRKSNEAYWNSHAELKTKLLNEKQATKNELEILQEKIKDLMSERDSVKSKKEFDLSELKIDIASKRRTIVELTNRLSELWFFKFEEKKELNEKLKQNKVELEDLEKRKNTLIDNMSNEIKKEIECIMKELKNSQDLIQTKKKRIQDIEEELNRNY